MLPCVLLPLPSQILQSVLTMCMLVIACLGLQMISPDDDDAEDALGGTLDQDAATAGIYLAAAGKGGMAGVEGAGDGGVMLSMPPMPHLT